ncbi:type II secretion system F family protein [Anoxybacillus flavithermus]|uniref:Type II secretion system F family protein n=1 Tax=Anoxybacillus flavithermus TaxID=33934 RepID=A0AAX2A4J2_9BACL|nr:type II secretion system F family protein [Anoxybacillus flavithermus]MBE2904323.1 type II secretion system F family protein [Anoxybacillus flavithermus]MBE2907032.1 type II secretion system F family protein [Anoxybacillus flavithermus]MBE2909650.1 type II secretion system F family protein [Anoxybacillus flavithermus]MBE2914971.1 type II secretion system F family protein [Anoxybacillus flavithermus]MBE2926309.1 type II secretion system F family protein [Anoxybacillus flavithermus]
MAQFRYEARDMRGRVKKGTIVAPSRRDVIMKLREQRLKVIDVREVPQTLLTKEITFGNPVKLQHFVIYLRQFATLLKAGVTIVDATRILAEQTESKALKKSLLRIEEQLRNGQPLSVAMMNDSKIFPPLVINMIRAGEASGSIDETLERLADHFEKVHRTRQKIVSALAYPIVVGIIAVIVVIFLLVGVVPTFVSMFADFGADLPAITKFVLRASEVMQTYWWGVLLLLLSTYGVLMLLRRQKKTKYYLDVIVLRMPIFGGMMQKAVLARMTRTLSSLFSSAVPILQALTIVEAVVENEVVARVIRTSRDALERGESLTEPMKRHWVFPPLVTQMIAIGEQTGSLDAMLAKVADFYEAEVEAATDRLKSLIEPLMIVLLAGVVGTIVTSILVPMFDIFNHIQQ